MALTAAPSVAPGKIKHYMIEQTINNEYQVVGNPKTFRLRLLDSDDPLNARQLRSTRLSSTTRSTRLSAPTRSRCSSPWDRCALSAARKPLMPPR